LRPHRNFENHVVPFRKRLVKKRIARKRGAGRAVLELALAADFKTRAINRRFGCALCKKKR
jgi:hypothetical protein